MPRTDVEIRTLIEATDIDVLPATSSVEDRGDYVVVRTPTNPTYHWGNFLMFRRPPSIGDRERWEAAFDTEFGADREYRHVSLCWDVLDQGAAMSEFVEGAGYDFDLAVALVAEPHELHAHARASAEVTVRVLDPEEDGDLWNAVLDLQVAAREPGHTEDEYRRFVIARMRDRRLRFRDGDGAWLVAQDGAGTVVGSCGIVVTHGRCRFQAVDTAPSHRRRGVATRLVHDAGRLAIEQFDARQLVIVADANYHAKALYESLGFVERERKLAVCWWPGAEHAAKHPAWASLARSAT